MNKSPEDYYPIFRGRAEIEASDEYTRLTPFEVMAVKFTGVCRPASFGHASRSYFDQHVPAEVQAENWNDFMDQYTVAWHETFRKLVWSK